MLPFLNFKLFCEPLGSVIFHAAAFCVAHAYFGVTVPQLVHITGRDLKIDEETVDNHEGKWALEE